jgi:hypothetical protein
MGRAGQQIVLLYRTRPGSPVRFIEGQYVRKTG